MAGKIYIDERGWRYRVMPGLSLDTFKGRYLKPNATGWHCMTALEWRGTPEEAQADLDRYAKMKGWKEVKEYG